MIMHLDGHVTGTSQRNLNCYSSLNLPIEQILCIQPLLTGSYIIFCFYYNATRSPLSLNFMLMLDTCVHQVYLLKSTE